MLRYARSFGPVVCLLVLAGWLPGQVRPARPALTPEVLRDAQRTDWYGAYLKGKKIGFVKTGLSRVGDAQHPGYLSTMLLHVNVLSAGEKLQLDELQEEEFDAWPPYRLRRARLLDQQGDARQDAALTRTTQGCRVTITHKGEKTVKDIPPVDLTLADVLASYVWLRGRPRPGATVLTQDFDLNELKMEQERRKLLGTKTALVKGVKLTYHEVEATILRHGVTTLERYDDAGNLLSGHVGEAFEMRLESEAQARNLDSGTDLFILGLVKIDRPLGDGHTVNNLVVEVKGKDAAFLPSGPRQLLCQDGAGGTLCKLGKRHGRPAQATAEEIQENLKATVSYPVNNARIQALARRAVGTARTDAEKVKRLVRFVHRYIRPSYRGKGTLVLSLLDTREGDCTAYAALLTALARAAGIPCREVSGLLYTGDEQKAFGGHAWNEVVLHGHWVPVDASCGETEIDATHISFGSDLRGGMNLLRGFGTLSLRLVEVEHEKEVNP
jgi:hypothetical protein